MWTDPGGLPPASPTEYFRLLSQEILADWSSSGKTFISLVPFIEKGLEIVLLGLLLLLGLHYLLIGPKRFTSGGKRILYYGPVVRAFHWWAALTFSLLVLTGLAIIFARILGGGAVVRLARTVHLLSAFGFVVALPPLFLAWVKDMLPASHDFRWLLMAGGYLSRKPRPVPAGKFNAGQKLWFWLVMIGGGVMFYTGFYLYLFSSPLKTLRWLTILHGFTGLILVGFFGIHLYMVLLAMKGALESMLTGYKSEEEIALWHPLFQPGSSS